MRYQSAASRLRPLAVGAVATVLFALALTGQATASIINASTEAQFELAVANDNSAGGTNTINLANAALFQPTQTIAITKGDLTINGVTTPDATTQVAPSQITGASLTNPFPGAPVFTVSAGATVTFNDLLMALSGSGGNGSIDDFGTVNINSSAIDPSGPALTVEGGAEATITNSTIADGLDFGILDEGTATLNNSTVTGNANGGIDNTGFLALNNSVVAQNGTPDCFDNPANVNDHSFDGDGTCDATATGNAMLGPLQLHGGTTESAIPKLGSPLIGAGDPAKCPTVDQRGAPSPSVAGHACDIGSVETYYGVAPVLTTAPVHVASPSAAGTVANYVVTWRAGSPVTSTAPVCSPASGSVFPVGQTTVTCNGTDSRFGGSTTTATFTVTDSQETPPVISQPSNVTATGTAASPSSAFVTYPAPVVTDATDGTSDTATCTAILIAGGQPVAVPPSGATYPVGTTTVTCNATDSESLSATPVTFTVTVTAYVPPPGPIFQAPAGVPAVTATSASGAVVTFSVTATDPGPAGGSDAVTCTPASGSVFPIGTTQVNCTATTAMGVTGMLQPPLEITVQPGDNPTVTVPADISVPATMPGGAQVTYTASATDPVDGSLAVNCMGPPGSSAGPSGSTFPIGTTTVTCSATDHNGNIGTATFTVTVSESTPPTVTVPANMTVAASSAAGAKVSFIATATDPVDGALTPVCAPASGATFPVGATTVVCTATDKAGLASSASFTVTVPVPGGPMITVPAFRELGALTSAGDVVTYAVTATDQVDKTDPVTCSPPSGANFPIGTTTVMCTATDSGGRTTSATFDVQVDPPSPASAIVFTLSRPIVEGSAAVLKLDLPSAGRIALSETWKRIVKGKTKYLTFAELSKSVMAGTQRLTVKPGSAGLAELRSLPKSRSLALTVAVTFTPKGGKAHVERATLKVKGLKP
jgi:HYR domain-containing protein